MHLGLYDFVSFEAVLAPYICFCFEQHRPNDCTAYKFRYLALSAPIRPNGVVHNNICQQKSIYQFAKNDSAKPLQIDET